jgi:iron(II)-dependent oxidoreductase
MRKWLRGTIPIDTLVAFLSGAFLLSLLLLLPSDENTVVKRTALALAAAAFLAGIPGLLSLDLSGKGVAVRGGSALVGFALVYLLNPAGTQPLPNEAGMWTATVVPISTATKTPTPASSGQVVPTMGPMPEPTVIVMFQDACKAKLDGVKMYGGPGTSYVPLKGTLLKGEAVAVQRYVPYGYNPEGQKQQGWLEVIHLGVTPGWIFADDLDCGNLDMKSLYVGVEGIPPTPALTSTVPAASTTSKTPAPTLLPNAGESMVITQPISMEFVRVPAGPFLMGSDPKRDPQARSSELDQHKASVPEFFIGKYEVTNEQYAAFVKATGRKPPQAWESDAIPSTMETYPVIVAWYDAVAFASWLSNQTGKQFRLPTEPEWEKACRGTDGQIYPWSNRLGTLRANYGGSMGLGQTTGVGQFSPLGDSRAYGSADMSGNVSEWTGSLWGPYPYNPADREQAPGADGKIAVRGGSWQMPEWSIRCAFRVQSEPSSPQWDTGFRLVMLPLD